MWSGLRRLLRRPLPVGADPANVESSRRGLPGTIEPQRPEVDLRNEGSARDFLVSDPGGIALVRIELSDEPDLVLVQGPQSAHGCAAHREGPSQGRASWRSSWNAAGRGPSKVEGRDPCVDVDQTE